MRTPRKNQDAAAPAPPATARGRRAHAGPPADEQETRATGPGPATPPGSAAPGAGEGTGEDGAAPAPAVAASMPAASMPAASAADGPVPGASAADGSVPGTRVPGGSVPGGSVPAPSPRGRGLRPRTVRAKIVSLLMVPVVSLLALWGFATVTTAQDMARLRQLQRVDADIRRPVSAAVAALQDERRAAVRQIAAPGAGRAAELKDRIRRTDEAVARLRLGDGHTVGDSGDLPADVGDRVDTFVGEARGLARLRAAAAEGRGDWDRVYDAYTTAVSAGFAVGGALTGIQDTGQGSHARVLLELARAGEMLSREDALLTSAHLTGRLTAAHRLAFAGAAETRRSLLASATADLPPAGRTAWSRLADGSDHARLTGAEDRVARAADGRPAVQAAPSADWDAALASVRTGLTAVENDARAASAEDTDPFAGGILSPAGAAVVLGLVAVAASLVISVRIGRGLVVELVSLRNTALGIARRKLPAAMGRLRAGEEIDVRAEAPPGPAPQDEIGQVGEALTTVHRAALSAAVERAELASGISGVFVNLARRSQVLVHRQLNLLDSMERRADDPGELGDLFRLDHLTTRMRRHAESLIILSGAAPGRAWRMPVPLTDVVRAAVSEIEDYARVEVRRLPETAVAGGAVADLTHLLAELIENAAQFSPPHTKVRVSGEPVGNGYALEIEDRGLGMGKETLTEANARIDRSDALDLFDSDRLGLFVVSRLSARHAVKVHLRPSPYGGTTAVVLLPTDLLQGDLAASHGTGADPVDAGTSRPDPASRGDERAALERAEARRAEARRFARPPADRRAPGSGMDAPTIRTGTGTGTGAGAGAGGGTGTGGTGVGGPAAPEAAPRTPVTPPSSGPERAPVRPQPAPRPPLQPHAQPRPRPTAVPALDPGPASAPAPIPAGVTTLRPRGQEALPRQASSGAGKDHVPVPGPDEADGDGGLPRRIRQASLVPQLRVAPAPEPVPVPAVAGAPDRTPEQVRDRMAAYRDGWQRGGGPAPGVRRPLGAGASSTGSSTDSAPVELAADPRTDPGTRPYGDIGRATATTHAAPHTAPPDPDPSHPATHAAPPDPAPYDPRGDGRARTDLGPYFGARSNPPQDPRSEGDDA
ncbi:nitrate- and nitrite sensing domain-containing protein [Streptomyces sp. NPDC056503]|uniref:sensor histidine kinase n=1 Tax=Streptomyces sp. NPDC056503 TaxID=3345842 RepID=UPI0036A43E88